MPMKFVYCIVEYECDGIRYADGQPCRIQTPPPGIPHQDSTVRSHRPCRHFPLRACPKTFLISPIDSTPTPGSGPRHRLPPLFNHTLPLRRPGQHLCTTTKHSACPPIPPAISERLCPPFPPTTLIAALVISTRETAPKHSARPLAHDDTFTTSRPPPLVLRDASSQQRSEGARCAVCCSYGGQ